MPTGGAALHRGVRSWEDARRQTGEITTGGNDESGEWVVDDDCYDYDEEMWVCPVCSRQFRSDVDLGKHLNSGTHDNARYFCGECDRTFSSLTGLTQHQTSTGHSPRQQRLVHAVISDARNAGLLMLTDGSMSTLPPEATLYFDGAARPNPGRGGYGYHINDNVRRGVLIASGSGSVSGRVTNNQAEYFALVMGLQEAARQGIRRLHVRGDSQLVIRQMRGEYNVNSPNMETAHAAASRAARGFQVVTYEHIDRSDNALADELAGDGVDM